MLYYYKKIFIFTVVFEINISPFTLSNKANEILNIFINIFSKLYI